MHPIHPHPWIPPDSTGAQDSSPQQHGDTGEERPGRPGCAASLAITAVDPHQDAGWGVTWLGTFAWPQPPKRVVSRVGVLIIYSILKIQCWLMWIRLRYHVGLVWHVNNLFAAGFDEADAEVLGRCWDVIWHDIVSVLNSVVVACYSIDIMTVASSTSNVQMYDDVRDIFCSHHSVKGQRELVRNTGRCLAAVHDPKERKNNLRWD